MFGFEAIGWLGLWLVPVGVILWASIARRSLTLRTGSLFLWQRVAEVARRSTDESREGVPVLGDLLECDKLLDYPQPPSWFDKRDEIKNILASHLRSDTTEKWLSILEPADIWCADVMTWESLMEHEGFKKLDMVHTVTMGDGYQYQSTRCPIKIDGKILTSPLGSPALGEHTKSINQEFLLNE